LSTTASSPRNVGSLLKKESIVVANAGVEENWKKFAPAVIGGVSLLSVARKLVKKDPVGAREIVRALFGVIAIGALLMAMRSAKSEAAA
jgi:hypothetical protein